MANIKGHQNIVFSVVLLYWPLSFLLSFYIAHCLFCCPFILAIVFSVVLLYWPLSFLLSFYIGNRKDNGQYKRTTEKKMANIKGQQKRQ
jgi:hypothetical protein